MLVSCQYGGFCFVGFSYANSNSTGVSVDQVPVKV